MTKQPVKIITSRPDKLVEAADYHMDLISASKHLFDYEIINTNYKSKRDVLVEHGVEYYVEDCLKYVHDITDIVKNVFLIAWPWNNVSDLATNVIRVSGHKHLKHELRKLSYAA